MDEEEVHQKLIERTREEPYARLLNMEVKEIGKGYSLVEMRFTPDMENVFGMAHGGAIYSLLDEAFQTGCNSHGTLAVAINVSISFLRPSQGDVLHAEGIELSRSRRLGSYTIRVTDADDELVAVFQGMVYRRDDPLRGAAAGEPTRA